MTTTSATKPRTLPWIRYSEDVDRQIEAGLARERVRRVAGAPPARPDRGAQPIQDLFEEATGPMRRLIDELLVEREHATLTDDVVDGIKANKPQAYRFIKFLLAQPRVQARPVVEVPVETPAPVPTRVRIDFDSIPDGNYAVDEGDDNIKFYRVSTNGRWKNVQVRASDTLYPLKGRAGIAVLHRIVEAGLAESRMLFATKLERCWMCGKSLTVSASRHRGLGPDCASK